MGSTMADLPYLAEYAKSGRSSCRKCKETIENRDLRLAVMVQSRRHDGKDPLWHHFECFFEKQKPSSVGQIGNVDNLKWEDQEKIKKKIGASSNGTTTKRDYKEYSVEYAKSSRSACVACEEKIEKQEIRISKLDHSSQTAHMIGGAPLPRYHHVKCFLQVQADLGFTGTPDKIPGFKTLSKDDQNNLRTQFETFKAPVAGQGKRKLSAKDNAVPAKVAKQDAAAGRPASSSKNDLESKKEAKMVKQNQSIHQLRDFLFAKLDSKILKKADLAELLLHNHQPSEGGPETLVDRLSDVMVFGALQPCTSCKGPLAFKSGLGYECNGYLSEFTKCALVTETPARKPFAVPESLEKKLAGYTFKKVSDRIIVRRVEGPAGSGPAGFVKINPAQLKGFKIFVSAVLPDNIKEEVIQRIEEHKGKVVKRVTKDVTAIVTNEAEMTMKTVTKINLKNKALALDIPVLSVAFITGLTPKTDLVAHMKANLLSDWTVIDNIADLVSTVREAVKPPGEEKTRRTLEKKEMNVRLQMKDGNVVDHDCEIADSTHVYKEGNLTYSVVLKRTDIDTNLNSFYKMQLLEGDKSKTYHVFRSWGRIGTVIGGHKLDEDLDLDEAIDLFHEKFTEKTLGNRFGKPFVMKPGGYMLLDISYDKPPEVTVTVSEKSKLPKSVQELVCLIFDVKKMLNTLVEFEIDTKKMPLGKLSREQILKAFEVLKGLMTELDKKKESSRMVVDYSNRFFSMIPHSFGLGSIPVLKDKAMVKAKLEMLEQLMDIELAYEMIQGGTTKGTEPVDTYYKRLGALIDPLETNSGAYKMIEKYLSNTHAATHANYKLNITNVYNVKRGGEDKRFEAFRKMENHQLLWHGSRTTNYAGILSQGLRIAPAEAPVTGYMFGKGIYFADMVSKSANYCYPSADNRSGLLLLCQVALGTPKEMKKSMDSLLKAPTGYNSVLGIGGTRPDPTVFTMHEEYVKVPYGLPTASGVKSELLYNEYIVYDPAQVQLRYIVKVDFEFGAGRRN